MTPLPTRWRTTPLPTQPLSRTHWPSRPSASWERASLPPTAGDNIEARLDMLLAASLAGLAFTSGSLGAPHALGFVLEEEFGLPHARAVTLMLPLIMEYNRIAALPRFASVAAALGEELGASLRRRRPGGRLSRSSGCSATWASHLRSTTTGSPGTMGGWPPGPRSKRGSSE